MSTQAEALRDYITRARALRLADPGGLRLPERIDAVVIVGSTCAGKTTISEFLRRSALVREGRVAVPHRFVTRPPRQDDLQAETVHVPKTEFAQKVASGDVALCWTRELESGRRERYGFPPCPHGQLAVYSGNNGLFALTASVAPAGSLDHALRLGVYAPDTVRERRLRVRSPDLWKERPDEVACRLADSSVNVLGHVHVVVENHGSLEGTAPDNVVRLITEIVSWRE